MLDQAEQILFRSDDLDCKIGESNKRIFLRLGNNLVGFFSSGETIHKNRHVIEVKKWPTAMWADKTATHTKSEKQQEQHQQTEYQRHRQNFNPIEYDNMIYCAIEWNTISIQTQTRSCVRYLCARLVFSYDETVFEYYSNAPADRFGHFVYITRNRINVNCLELNSSKQRAGNLLG